MVDRRRNVHGGGLRVVSGRWRAAQNGASVHAFRLGAARQRSRIWAVCRFEVPSRNGAATSGLAAGRPRGGRTQGRGTVIDRRGGRLRPLIPFQAHPSGGSKHRRADSFGHIPSNLRTTLRTLAWRQAGEPSICSWRADGPPLLPRRPAARLSIAPPTSARPQYATDFRAWPARAGLFLAEATSRTFCKSWTGPTRYRPCGLGAGAWLA